MFKCPRCNQEYASYSSLSRHTGKSYNLRGEELYREYNGIVENPICKCGCGTPTKWRSDRGYADYATGHNARGETNPMFGKTHSEEAKTNISSKRKEKFANGEYTFIDPIKRSENAKELWASDEYRENMKNARKNSGWKKKLSNKMSGENHPFYGKKRPEHSALMRSPEMMERIFKERSMTDIEQIIASMLDQANIEYHSQFFITDVDSNTYSYDFKLKDTNILIEADGDYWHGNPDTTNHVPYVSEVQQKDIIKAQVAEAHGYKLIRFWGKDIKERPFWVLQQILT